MKFVIQRVSQAKVEVDQQIIGEIQQGFLVLIGVTNTDTKEIADKMIQKLIQLRIFEDENGKTNISLHDVNGELLLVSQFTLYADCRKGNRPSFTQAGDPTLANDLYQYIIKECRKQISKVATGQFGADMKISLVNEGPFTIVLDSKELFDDKALPNTHFDKKILLDHIEEIQTTELGVLRIKNNILQEVDDVVGWCKQKIRQDDALITKQGKNWYIIADGYTITINATSYNIITVHKNK